MSINNNYLYQLRFHIDSDSPHIDKWQTLKHSCESGNNQDIVKQWIIECIENSNKCLPYLNRFEGGLGGNSNNVDKQIRFRNYELWHPTHIPKDYDIVMDKILNTEQEQWTYNELDDLIFGFIKMANKYKGNNGVYGSIQMINKHLNHDYFINYT